MNLLDRYLDSLACVPSAYPWEQRAIGSAIMALTMYHNGMTCSWKNKMCAGPDPLAHFKFVMKPWYVLYFKIKYWKQWIYTRCICNCTFILKFFAGFVTVCVIFLLASALNTFGLLGKTTQKHLVSLYIDVFWTQKDGIWTIKILAIKMKRPRQNI